MKANKNIYDMTDRELRAYKRLLRRRKLMLKKCLLLVFTICLVFVGTISFHAIRSSANSGENELQFKYYTNITVAYGETLWDIADEYIDYTQYKDKSAYIAEVCSINHLNADASIKAGQMLIVPYFSSEFVK